MTSYFLWLKAGHIIFFVTWFSGLFYLPRLFVYHAMSNDTASNERFKVMERKLYRGINTPSAILTLFFGTWMLINGWEHYKTAGWMHAKLTLIFILLFYHHLSGYYLKQFKLDRNTKSHVFFRWFNEIPVIILIAIVILATLKPF